MQTYVILRRGGWQTAADLEEAAARSTAEGDAMSDDVRWIRSYVTAETDGTVGTVCIYQGSGPEAIREHARRADLRPTRSSRWPTRSSCGPTRLPSRASGIS
jgi:hypothetical protein